MVHVGDTATLPWAARFERVAAWGSHEYVVESAVGLGRCAAAVAGVLAIWTFVLMLKRKSFHHFGPYCWTVGGFFLLYLLFLANG